jgi:hypothetical protein
MFLAFNIINFNNNYLYDQIIVSNPYPGINGYFAELGYNSYIFMYNTMDVVLFMGAFLALIPVFYLVAKCMGG